MNMATFVTAIRIALAPVFFLVYTMTPPGETTSLPLIVALWALFIVMEVSDFLDGMVARKTNTVSDFGKLFDPFADSLSRLTYFFAFAISGRMPAWVFIPILYRDLGVSFVRILTMKQGIAMGAQLSGKIKAWVYAVAGGCGIMVLTAETLMPENVTDIIGKIAYGFYIASALTAVWTMLDYAKAYRTIKGAKS